MKENTVYEDRYFEVISPVPALHCRDDGGHLILIKKEKVHDRLLRGQFNDGIGIVPRIPQSGEPLHIFSHKPAI